MTNAALLTPTSRRQVADLNQLDFAGHGADHDGPMFRPLRSNAAPHDPAGQMVPHTIDLVVQKFAASIGLERGSSAHSMPAAFITAALENGAQLEDTQKATGHHHPSTPELYDRWDYNPEKPASFLRPIGMTEQHGEVA